MGIMLIGFMLMTTGIPTSTALAQQPAAPTEAPQAAPPEQLATFFQLSLGTVTEEELAHQIVGKQLYLRGGYQGENLHFDSEGDPVGDPAKGSFTLSSIKIEKVRLSKKKVELEGARYAIHFLGALPGEDSSKDAESIRVTPKKKMLHITIDRESIEKVKVPKQTKKFKKNQPMVATTPSPTPEATPAPAPAPVASSETDVATTAPPAAEQPSPVSVAPTTTSSNATVAPLIPKNRPALRAHSVAQSSQMLQDALNRTFAQGLDDSLRAQMPEFWQTYFKAQAAGMGNHPLDPAVLRPSAVDQQAKVLSSISPASNEIAQANGIAGAPIYRAIVGVDGRADNISPLRPIGVGLDENAVAAIQKASFQPAMKNGQPVAEVLDLAVIFRIGLDGKAQQKQGVPEIVEKSPAPKAPVLPGPYSAAKPQP